MLSISSEMMQLLVTIAGCGAVYGGIRADLKAMHEKIKAAQDAANEAHKRMDAHLDKK